MRANSLNTKQTGEASDGRKVFYNSSLSFLTCRNQPESTEFLLFMKFLENQYLSFLFG